MVTELSVFSMLTDTSGGAEEKDGWEGGTEGGREGGREEMREREREGERERG